jgi:hypothetical protein
MATQRGSKQPGWSKGANSEEDLLRLYEPYRHLEAEHWGEVLAAYPDGRYVLGTDEVQVMRDAVAAYGPGFTMFKIGPIAMGNAGWRLSHSLG